MAEQKPNAATGIPQEPESAGEHTTDGDEEQTEVHQSIEEDHTDDFVGRGNDASRSSSHSSRRTPERAEDLHTSYVPPTVTVDDGAESSSQHEATDEDVFSDKSGGSSGGSYDGGSEHGKDADNMTTITRSPRISDISQYEKEEFIPTSRDTPRPPFRTPSDVRAMQMSSPTASVFGSPRPAKRQFPTVSRLGTPNTTSSQLSPKRKSTPPRFKSRKEPPLVLLHVTLLPLRWVWGDLLNNLETAELSEQAKTLRDSWRILQDRVGDTVIERGILLGHPQNDYEVLEERLLEALELPLRCRARILECGHYLGPANEMTITDDEESDDGYGYEPEHRRNPNKRHWCGTCRNEIRYEALGTAKLFRIKVYASNGLMKAGAWEACWKEMERVDVELEPVVEPAVQDELVRLAATQEERELAHQEEAEIAREVAHQLEQQKQKERADMLHPHFEVPSASPQPEGVPEHVRRSGSAEDQWRESEQERHRRDEERMREIYGDTPTPQSHSPSREPSTRPQEDSHMPHPNSYAPPPAPQSPSKEGYERQQNHQANYQQASLPELVMQSVRVLMQDHRNVIIFTLSVFVLVLALRRGPTGPAYEQNMGMHTMKDVPVMEHIPIVQTQPNQPVMQKPAPQMESIESALPAFEEAPVQKPAPTAESVVPPPVPNHGEAPAEEPLSAVESEASLPVADDEGAPAQESTPVESSASPANDGVTPNIESEQEQGAPREEPKPELETEPVETALSPEEPQEPSMMKSDPASGPIQERNTEPAENAVSPESPAAEQSVSTIYEPCVKPPSSPSKPSCSAVASEPEEPQSEVTETVTQRTVMRVVRTVTETKVQTAVETETAFETVRVTSTEVVKAPAPTSTSEVEVEVEVNAQEEVQEVCAEVKEEVEEDPKVELEAPEVEAEVASSDEAEVDAAAPAVVDVSEEAFSNETTADAEFQTAFKVEAEETPVLGLAEAETEAEVELQDEELLAAEPDSELSKDQMLISAAECENLRAIVAEQLAAASAASATRGVVS
ncbi:hypothetical protein F5B20DRAFT_522798 [Whalleya microplaca]|nr:hypothetical protein F5B20DRAFT_522798 [Whalleya microplaca]